MKTSPQQVTGYQNEVGPELAEETKQASRNPPIEIDTARFHELLDMSAAQLIPTHAP